MARFRCKTKVWRLLRDIKTVLIHDLAKGCTFQSKMRLLIRLPEYFEEAVHISYGGLIK